METTEFITLLEQYVKDLFDKHQEYNDKHFPELQRAHEGSWNRFNAELGRKYAKIISTSGGQRSVHCFVEIETGNILKSATWNKPATGVRGNLKDEKRPIFLREFYKTKI